MAVTGWSGSNYLRRQSQVYDTLPLMLSIWGYDPSANTAEGRAFELNTDGSANNVRAALGLLATTRVVFALTRSSTSAFSSSATGRPADAWFHMFGEFDSTTNRIASLNDVAGTANTTSNIPTASNAVYIGGRGDTLAQWSSTGALAEASIWSGASMTQTDQDTLRNKLYTGDNPLAIDAEAAQPWTGLLIAYWRLSTHTDLTDLTLNGHDLATVGTLSTFGTHPPVDAVPGGAAAYTQVAYRWRAASGSLVAP